jgi:hypothetical protein
LKKEAKKSQKIERSQAEFLVAKQSQKKPKSRNLALFAPNWQPCPGMLAAFYWPE